jgi:UDP-N-acetylmuramate--alanine ligase
MRSLPLDIGVIHFVGIGGIGMSGIAEILHNLGYKVRGSDISESYVTKRLRDLKIPVEIGHRPENLADAEVVVISSAVKPDNPEVIAARAKLLPVVRRAEMLAELMRLKWSVAIGGTHGKTTTTSMVAALIDAAGLDPTVINGGIINNYGTNARLGAGDWMVVEADESDGTFVKLPAVITIVTNMDPEHLDHYGSVEAMNRAYEDFVHITYGFSPQADVRATDLRLDPAGSTYNVVINDRFREVASRIDDVHLPMVGQHNVQNSLAAIAVAYEMRIPEGVIQKGFAGFGGVKRRFSRTGEANGVIVIDDYGHHPVEIAAVLKAARQATQGKVIAVVQPHRYTRLANLFEDFCTCFNDADVVLAADVYAAGEQPIEGVSGEALAAGLRARGHRHVEHLKDPKELAKVVAPLAMPGDLVVCLGAGSITYWAQALPAELQALYGKSGTGA